MAVDGKVKVGVARYRYQTEAIPFSWFNVDNSEGRRRTTLIPSKTIEKSSIRSGRYMTGFWSDTMIPNRLRLEKIL